MSGPTGPRAAFGRGGSVLRPPIARAEAETILGRTMPPEVWCAIERAFGEFGRGLAALAASKAAGKKDDPLTWRGRQDATVRELEQIMTLLCRARARRGFLAECRENYALRNNALGGPHLEHLLGDAYGRVLHAIAIVERAEPMSLEVASEPQLRRGLALAVADALRDADIPVALSDGWALERMEGVSGADLTPFESLVDALGIHDSVSLGALSRWLRRAMGQN